jgi:hypothetical protein
VAGGRAAVRGGRGVAGAQAHGPERPLLPRNRRSAGRHALQDRDYEGPGPEEFESIELRKETVLAPGVTRSVVFAPLKPGVYRFFGEFHPDTAQGRIVVK